MSAKIDITKQKEDKKEVSASSYIKNEIKKVWTELKKTSTKDEINKIRDDLEKIRIEFKNDLKKYATKDDLFKSVQELIDYIHLANEQTKKELREEIQDMKKDLKGDIAQFKDDILQELIKIRDDLAVVVGYREHIENHEVRIHKLEKSRPN